MSLAIGTRIGPYEITGTLGVGGMGEVYRAHDARLARDVALKVLPDIFAKDPERLARFQREAQVLAALKHPNIGAIYGLEEGPAEAGRYVRALVLELVEGETLADRIARGPIPLEETLAIAKQIAEAIEAAHEQGIIHRDLKPANIKVSPDGFVKVLDFGLAKLTSPAEAGHYVQQRVPLDGPGVRLQPGLTASPTITSPAMMTGAGTILGTAAYMAPEQAKGRPVDKRSDVWAFGCVLYEMLAGRAAFAGDTVSEIISEVLKSDPDWQRLPLDTPATIRRLLRRCMAKDPTRRLRDIGDARLDIDDARSGTAEDAPPPQAAARRERLVLVMALALVMLVAAWLAVGAFRSAPAAPVIQLELTTPPTTDPVSLAISPDGQNVVFVATREGRPALWLRPLDADSAQPLAGTAGGSYPFWSSDSRSIGFFADAKLKRIDIDGGSLQVLANATAPPSPGTWNRDGVILYSPVPGRPILRVAATGGPVVAATRIEPSQESGHSQPRFLPDGRHFFYTVGTGDDRSVYVGQLGQPERVEPRRVIQGGNTPMALSSGHVIYVRGETLLAQAFDLDRLELTGTPIPLGQGVQQQDVGASVVAASDTGTIVFRRGAATAQNQFTWFDRSGKETGRVGDPDPAIHAASMAPDGRRLAVFRLGGNVDVWLLELARGVLSRFTSDPGNDVLPIWSPDGTRVVFSSTRNGGVHDLYQKAASGAGAEGLLLKTQEDKMATDWSPDGRHVLYYTFDLKTQNDIFALPMNGVRKPFAVVQTEFEERNAQFSPDGQWIAYQSNESGQFEIYVQPFSGPGERSRISTDGGAQARWRPDGRELFYIALDGRLMAVPIRVPDGRTVEAGTPVALFPTRPVLAVEHFVGPQYVVAPDGQRFLINTLAERPTAPITILLNWRPAASN